MLSGVKVDTFTRCILEPESVCSEGVFRLPSAFGGHPEAFVLPLSPRVDVLFEQPFASLSRGKVVHFMRTWYPFSMALRSSGVHHVPQMLRWAAVCSHIVWAIRLPSQSANRRSARVAGNLLSRCQKSFPSHLRLLGRDEGLADLVVRQGIVEIVPQFGSGPGLKPPHPHRQGSIHLEEEAGQQRRFLDLGQSVMFHDQGLSFPTNATLVSFFTRAALYCTLNVSTC